MDYPYDIPGVPSVETRVADVTTLTDAWFRASRHATRSIEAANRAVLAAYGCDDVDVEPGVDSVAYERADWSTERTVSDPGSIDVHDTVRFSKQITAEDVRHFAEASGDTNRVHLDEEFAARTRFGRPIVHGTLVAGLLSAALARLPGLTIYLSQETRFTAPVDIGERLTAVVEVVEDIGDGRYRLATKVVDDEDTEYVTGEAVVLIEASVMEAHAPGRDDE